MEYLALINISTTHNELEAERSLPSVDFRSTLDLSWIQ